MTKMARSIELYDDRETLRPLPQDRRRSIETKVLVKII